MMTPEERAEFERWLEAKRAQVQAARPAEQSHPSCMIGKGPGDVLLR